MGKYSTSRVRAKGIFFADDTGIYHTASDLPSIYQLSFIAEQKYGNVYTIETKFSSTPVYEIPGKTSIVGAILFSKPAPYRQEPFNITVRTAHPFDNCLYEMQLLGCEFLEEPKEPSLRYSYLAHFLINWAVKARR